MFFETKIRNMNESKVVFSYIVQFFVIESIDIKTGAQMFSYRLLKK